MKGQKDISDEFLKAIGKNVKEKREERKLSLAKLGAEIGMSRSMVLRVEKGLNSGRRRTHLLHPLSERSNGGGTIKS